MKKILVSATVLAVAGFIGYTATTITLNKDLQSAAVRDAVPSTMTAKKRTPSTPSNKNVPVPSTGVSKCPCEALFAKELGDLKKQLDSIHTEIRNNKCTTFHQGSFCRKLLDRNISNQEKFKDSASRFHACIKKNLNTCPNPPYDVNALRLAKDNFSKEISRLKSIADEWDAADNPGPSGQGMSLPGMVPGM